jgi:quercetin dioxygenase-like cupin family protein
VTDDHGDAHLDTGGEAPCFAPFLDDLDLRDPPARHVVVVELGAVPDGDDGVAWHLPHDGELDANLVRLGPGGTIGGHRNDEVDVLIIVRTGTAGLRVDDDRRELGPGTLALVPRGAVRAIDAGTKGVEYLSIHRRRAGLSIGRAPGQRDQSSTR